ncbi:hypothetical protein ACHAXT_002510 [Thalassiosira profunda]
MPPLLLAVVALSAAGGADALQLTPRPPKTPPSSESSGAPRPAWGQPRAADRRQRSTPLRAYTVAENNKNGNNWLSFLNFPRRSLEDFAAQFGADASLFSLEGGNAGAAATRPRMPNLELEAATITAATVADVGDDMETEALLSELTSLTKLFDDLQSDMDYSSQLYTETIQGYDAKVAGLEEENASLEAGLQTLTATLERQEQQLKELQKGNKNSAGAQGDEHNDVSFLLQVQENVVELEGENEMLRQRLRALEVELSDVAFESRHRVEVAPPAAVASSVQFSPKAPSAPVPEHLLVEQLQLQVAEYQRERSSVRKLFGLGMRRGMSKVGRALNVWSPVTNLRMWGRLRG